MGYGIGLAGLDATAQAIDVVSNDIANAQTVGFKSAQFVFADMYFKASDAQAKDRVGMGSQQQAIRRDQSYGTLTTTQNPLDLAITGPGMFMLAKDTNNNVPIESPNKFEYTRNGQFGTNKDNKMINQSGLFVVGYPADATGAIIAGAKSTMTLDQAPLPSLPTTKSEVALNLDTRGKLMNIPFNPTDSTTYSQATSQTIYDQNGTGHILGLFYKRVSPQPLTLTLMDNGDYQYSPTQAITPQDNEQLPIIASTYLNEDKKYQGAAGASRALVRGGVINSDLIDIQGAVKTLTGGAVGMHGSTYDLKLADGTHIPITQTSADAPSTDPVEYSAMTDRFEVYATIDGNKVGHDPATDADSQIIITGQGTLTQPMSVGTIAFLGGHNIDTMTKGADGTPINHANHAASSQIELNALSGNGYGDTAQDGIMQFTINMDKSTGLTAPAQTYVNSQDGHSVSNLSGYSIDSSGKLIATYDNGLQHVKGQLILAQFGNVDGLMPNGSNTFAATAASGDPILSAPGTGLLGQVRSKSLESSNVDLTAMLVQLMVLQRQYSANSQALKLQASTIVDDAINMGR